MLAVVPAPPSPAVRQTLCCAHCGRRLLEYADLGTAAVIRVRCRCKGFTELRGADVPTLLAHLGQGGD